MKARMAHQDREVQLENVDLQDKVEHLELKVHLDNRGPQDPLETEDSLVLL